MPVTAVSVANSALLKVGASRISSLDQDNPAAVAINSIFELSRDEVLRAHPWNFAIKRATLAPTGTTPDSEYEFEYDLPSDCLRVWDLYSNYSGPDSVDWVVEGNRKLLADESEIAMIYIFRAEDPSTWDSMFAEAFAWYLAWKTAYKFTQSVALADRMEKGYKTALAEARSIDGMEGKIKNLQADVWALSRR